MDATIYKPSRNTMQAGQAKTGEWVLEYDSISSRKPEPLMGWTAAGDTVSSLKALTFPSLEEAVEYARNMGLNATVLPARAKKVKPRNYVDNFRYFPEDGTKS